jgi:hypothetical protein
MYLIKSIFALILFIIVSLAAVLTTACDTVMPDHDDTPPELGVTVKNYEYEGSESYFNTDTFIVVNPFSEFQLLVAAYDAEGIKSLKAITTTFVRCIDVRKNVGFETSSHEISFVEPQAQPGDSVKTLLHFTLDINGAEYFNYECKSGERYYETAQCPEAFGTINDKGMGGYIHVITTNQVGLAKTAVIVLRFEEKAI